MGGIWGWGVTAHIPTLAFSTLLSPHCCSSLSSWAQTWATRGAPRKTWHTAFFASILDKRALSWPRGSSWAAQGWRFPRPRGSVAQQEAGTEHCCRWNQVEQPITHTQPPFFLFVHTVSVFQIKIHFNHQSQASSNPPAAMSQET